MGNVQKILEIEPWRNRQGQPRNALQLDWLEEPVFCTGEIEFDKDSTRYWTCKTCGYCSFFTHTAHCKPEHPADYYKEAFEFFMKRRAEQGMSRQLAEQQAQHIAGTVLRTVAKLSPEAFAQYIDQHILLND